MKKQIHGVLETDNRLSCFKRSEFQLKTKQNVQKKEVLKSKHNSVGVNSYKFIQMIGKGTFGKVYSAIQISTNKKVAIKVVELYGNYKNRELDIIRKIKHQNCIQLQRHFTGYDHQSKKNKNYELTLYLVMEELDFSLAKYVQVRRKRNPIIMNEIQIKIISFQLLKALDYLDCNNICHRDLKPQNVLINRQTLQIKICDYGSAKIIEQDQTNLAYICSRYYRAPELLFGYTKYTTAVDTWSFGCILLQLLIGQAVFPGDSTIDQIIQIMKILGTPSKQFFDEVLTVDLNILQFPKIESLRLQNVFSKSRMSSNFFQFIKKCLVYDWRKRIRPFQGFFEQFFFDICDAKYEENTKKLPSLFDFQNNLWKCTQEQRQKIVCRFGSDSMKVKPMESNKQNISTEASSYY